MRNAAGLDVSGHLNPNWKGGLLRKSCIHCWKEFLVKPGYVNARFCSLVCCNRSNERRSVINLERAERTELACAYCQKLFKVLASSAHRWRCCSKPCSFKWRSQYMRSKPKPNCDRLGYPRNWGTSSSLQGHSDSLPVKYDRYCAVSPLDKASDFRIVTLESKA